MTAPKYPALTWTRTRPYLRTKERAKHQCPVCIDTIQEGRMCRHLSTKHPEFNYVGSDVPAEW